MPCHYSITLLQIDLEKETRRKNFNAEYFAEKGGQDAYNQYCQALARCEDLEEAIAILKNHFKRNR